MNTTGSPDPVDSYSSSTPLTLILSMVASSWAVRATDRLAGTAEEARARLLRGVTAGVTRRWGRCEMGGDRHRSIEAAHAAAGARDWGRAFELFVQADADGVVSLTD